MPQEVGYGKIAKKGKATNLAPRGSNSKPAKTQPWVEASKQRAAKGVPKKGR